MLKHIALSSLSLLFGCSDFWGTYQLIDDMGSSSELGSSDLCKDKKYYTEAADSIFIACCVDDDATTSSNLQEAFRASQMPGTVSSSVIVKLACPNRSLNISSLATNTGGEKSLLPTISKNTEFQGNGATLKGNSLARFFLVKKDVGFTVQNVTLMDGSASDIPIGAGWNYIVDSITDPTVAAFGGSILSFGPVTLNRVAIVASKAQHTARAQGGAIFMAGSPLTMTNSIIYKNYSTVTGPNLNPTIGGSAIFAVNSPITIKHSTIMLNENKTAGTKSGGAIELLATSGEYAIVIDKNIIFNYNIDPLPATQFDNYSIYTSCYTSPNQGSFTVSYPGINAIDKTATVGCAKVFGAGASPLKNIARGTWADPLALSTPSQLSPSYALDAEMIGLTTNAGCADSGRDFFGNPRPTAKCMLGAVNPTGL